MIEQVHKKKAIGEKVTKKCIHSLPFGQNKEQTVGKQVIFKKRDLPPIFLRKRVEKRCFPKTKVFGSI